MPWLGALGVLGGWCQLPLSYGTRAMRRVVAEAWRRASARVRDVSLREAVALLPYTTGATALVSDVKAPTCLALDETYVYWTSDETDLVRKVKKEGGAPITLAENQKSPTGIAVTSGLSGRLPMSCR